MTSGWYWPKTEKGEVDWKAGRGGTFRGALFRGLIREVIQNSKDWPADKIANEAGKSPVRMEFELVELNRNQIPGIDENLINQLELCLESARATKRFDDAESIQQAIKSLKKSSILCLHVNDTNTAGMTAILDTRAYSTSSFGTYMVCESSKQDGRGGSHGQGKFAPLLSSSARIIFASSVNENKELVCGGRCLFSSVRDQSSGEIEEPDGYWGTGNNVLPISKPPSAFKWLEREEQGTSIWIIGLKEDFREEFAYRAAAIAASSYFSAIYRNRLELVFKDPTVEIAVDHKNIGQILDQPKIHQLIEQNDDDDFEPSPRELKNSQWYFKAFSSQSDGRIFEEKVPLGKGLGFAKIKLLLADGAPRGCLYLRRDMAVLDTNLKSLNENSLYMAKMGDCRPWCAVVEFEESENSKINDFIRSMEPAAHDTINMKELLAQVGGDKSRKAQIEKDVKAIRYAIREFIRSKAEVEVEESEAIDWMNPTGNAGAGQSGKNEFARFSNNTRGFRGAGATVPNEGQIGKINIPAPPKRKKKTDPETKEKKRRKKRLDGPVFRKKFMDGEKNLAFSARSRVAESRHRLTAIIEEIGDGTLYVMQVGGDLSAYKQLKVVETTIGTVSKGGVHMSDVKSEKIVMDVKFAEDVSDGSTILSWVPDEVEGEES